MLALVQCSLNFKQWKAGWGLGMRQHAVWKMLTVRILSLTDAALEVLAYLVMTIFHRDLADGQLLSSQRG